MTGERTNDHRDLPLEALNAVDWAQLTHAYGPATNTPALLAALCSRQEARRLRAWGELWDTLAHQGSLFPATAAAVPPLLLLLAEPATPGREAILEFLAYLAEATAWPHDEAAPAVRTALLAGLPVFLAIAEEEAALRSLAVYALGWLREAQASIAPRLRVLMGSASEPGVQATILLALADLLPRDHLARELFAAQLDAASHPVVRAVAAAALIDRDEEQAPEAAVATICACLDWPGTAGPAAPQRRRPATWLEACLPAGRRDLEGDFWSEDGILALLAALGKLGPLRGLPLLLERLPSLPYGRQMSALLLALAFARPWRRAGVSLHHDSSGDFRPIDAHPPSLSTELSDAQRAVLGALLSYEPLWALDDDLSPLGMYRLPSHRALLQAVLHGRASEAPPPLAPPALTGGIGTAAPPAPDRARRVEQIEQALRQAGLRPALRSVVVAYLLGEAALEDVQRVYHTLPPFTVTPQNQLALVLSDSPFLDTLDLAQLDICMALGVADLVIRRVASEERVAQAYAHLHHQQRRYPTLAAADVALEALALAEGCYVAEGRPTALGRLLLAGMPRRVRAVLRLRQRNLGRSPRHAEELLDLLMAPDPPYTAEALALMESIRR